MAIIAAPWYAKHIGVSTRKKAPVARQKSRSRERKTAAATPKRTFRRAAAIATKRIVRKAAVAPQKRSFAELLEVAGAPSKRTAAVSPTAQPPSRAMPHRSTPAARGDAACSCGQLSAVARRIIELGAEARGESLAPDGIEAQLKRERDDACGIGSVARKIINRAIATPRDAKRLDREIRAQRQHDRDEALGITPAACAIIDRVEARA